MLSLWHSIRGLPFDYQGGVRVFFKKKKKLWKLQQQKKYSAGFKKKKKNSNSSKKICTLICSQGLSMENSSRKMYRAFGARFQMSLVLAWINRFQWHCFVHQTIHLPNTKCEQWWIGELYRTPSRPLKCGWNSKKGFKSHFQP